MLVRPVVLYAAAVVLGSAAPLDAQEEPDCTDCAGVIWESIPNPGNWFASIHIGSDSGYCTDPSPPEPPDDVHCTHCGWLESMGGYKYKMCGDRDFLEFPDTYPDGFETELEAEEVVKYLGGYGCLWQLDALVDRPALARLVQQGDWHAVARLISDADGSLWYSRERHAVQGSTCSGTVGIHVAMSGRISPDEFLNVLSTVSRSS